jgi:hypothetical protein
MMVADFSHLGSAAKVSARRRPTRRLVELLGDVVRCATSSPAGMVIETPLRCPKRPGGHACQGWLWVVRSEVPKAIRWGCGQCRDGGVVTNWEDTPYDLAPAPHRTDRELTISLPEHRLLCRCAGQDRSALRLLYGAERQGGGIVVWGSTEEWSALTARLRGLEPAGTGARRARSLLKRISATG